MDIDKYYLALGRFVHEYAHVENDLYVLLLMTAKAPKETGPAIFSGTRVAAAISFIKRIHEARGEETTQRLSDVFSHLNAITTARDHILHMGVYVSRDGKSFNSQNLMRAHAVRTRKVLDASPEALDEMTEDLKTISRSIVHYQTLAFGTSETDWDAELKKAGRLPPWRYRPSERGIQGPQMEKTIRKLKAQPPPSQE